MDIQQNNHMLDYSSLMNRRIRRILLVCSSYDSYTLEEDGRIEAQITHEYSELNLSNPPSIYQVQSTIEALPRRIDLISVPTKTTPAIYSSSIS